MGKLVPQDPSDEPASVLLEKSFTEKSLLIKNKVISKTKPQAEIDDKETPHTIPASWVWVRFGDIAQHNSGKTLDKSRNSGTSRKYLTTSNLYWGQFKLDTVKEMLIRDDELDRCTAEKGDLLICEGGEAGRAAVWEKEYNICFQNHVHRARFYSACNPYYAYRLFEKITYTGEINNYRKGVGISNMSGKSLSSVIFPLPPEAEQYRIIAKVDELISLCDELKVRLQESQKTQLHLADAMAEQALNS
jgi:type I restriction enzyme S subunit